MRASSIRSNLPRIVSGSRAYHNANYLARYCDTPGPRLVSLCYEIKPKASPECPEATAVCGAHSSVGKNAADRGHGGMGAPPSASNALPEPGHGGMGAPPSASNALPEPGHGGMGAPPSASNALPEPGHGGMGAPPSASSCDACQPSVGRFAQGCSGLPRWSIATARIARPVSTRILGIRFIGFSPYLLVYVTMWISHAYYKMLQNGVLGHCFLDGEFQPSLGGSALKNSIRFVPAHQRRIPDPKRRMYMFGRLNAGAPDRQECHVVREAGAQTC